MTAITSTVDAFQAFADPTRLRILNLLHERELCVCEITAVLDMSQPKVSRHLAILRAAGLCDVRQEGKWRHYSLATDAVGVQRTLLDCVAGCLREMDLLRDDLQRLRSLAGDCETC